jgi:gamma-glutamyltranspeptidase/glutathione hydrolase
MVVTAHPDATKVGVQILKDGGNAVDAAVAVAFALSVVEPYSSGVGGGGFTVYFDKGSAKVHAVDGRERAPAALTQAHFHPEGSYNEELSRWSGLAVGVPGLVAQMHELHAKFGKLPFAELVRPAEKLAREGFVVTHGLSRRIAVLEEHLNLAAKGILMPNGKVPEVGSRLIQSDKAKTLSLLAEHGPDAFYKGEVAEKIVASVRKAGGVMTLEDMATYTVRWREALHGVWRGMDVYSFPPPSSGGAVLLRMLHGVGQGRDLTEAGWHSSHEIHILVELMKRAYAGRNLFLADPDHADVPIERFTDPAAGKRDRRAIRKRATPAKRILNPRKLIRNERSHTSHFSIVDGEGNAVSQTQTINLTFGSGIVAEGTGVVLNNEIDDFSTSPGKPNAFGLVQGSVNNIAPGKRPLSSMTPTIVLRDGSVDAVVGSPGGSFIITSVFQTLLNRYVHRMDPGSAVCMPRIHHQWLPDAIAAEPFAISADTAKRLVRKRHMIHERGTWSNVQAIFRTVDGWHGAADCRGEGRAQGF